VKSNLQIANNQKNHERISRILIKTINSNKNIYRNKTQKVFWLYQTAATMAKLRFKASYLIVTRNRTNLLRIKVANKWVNQTKIISTFMLWMKKKIQWSLIRFQTHMIIVTLIAESISVRRPRNKIIKIPVSRRNLELRILSGTLSIRLMITLMVRELLILTKARILKIVTT